MGSEYGARGGLVSPRVHLPVRAGASPPAPAPTPPPSTVSIHQPRPDLHRHLNEYVETPLRPECATRTSVTAVSAAPPQRHKPSGGGGGRGGVVVTDQPGGKGSAGTSAVDSTSGDCSIICRECGRCRCDACRRPRPMPSLWLCRDFCLCSAESCVDYGSCLCCVKGLMYHCASRDGDDDTCADDPCSCGPDRRVGRWACLGLTALLLPCLCCYWPLRALSSCAQSCYATCNSRGCRCEPRHTPEKRLLDSSPEL